MTAQEALAGFQRLQEKFPGGRRYKGAELNAVWAELLPCSVEAFDRTIGIAMKRCQWLPAVREVVNKTLEWDSSMKAPAVPAKVEGEPAQIEGEAAQARRLMRQHFEDEIDIQAFIAGLYRLSEVFGRAEYAQHARRKELQLQAGGVNDY